MPETIFGRSRELLELDAAFVEVSEHAGGIVFATGEIGIGKTRLLRAWRSRLNGGVRSVFVKCNPEDLDRPFGIWRRLLEVMAREILVQDNSFARSLQAELCAVLGESRLFLVPVLPELQQFLGLEEGLANNSHSEKGLGAWPNGPVRVFLEVFARISGRAVLFLDDMHWADHASLEFLKVLIKDGVRGCMIVVSYRSVAGIRNLQWRYLEAIRLAYPSIHCIRLQRLGIDSVREMVGEALGCHRKDVESLVNPLQALSEGNPFALLQSLKFMQSRNAIQFYSDRGWELMKERYSPVNETSVSIGNRKWIQGMVPAEHRKLLQTSACVGFRLDFDLLSRVLPGKKSPHNLRAAVSPLYSIGILKCEGEEVAFAHDRIREFIYAGIPKLKRKEIHSSIARTLGAEGEERRKDVFAIARHFNLGDLSSPITRRRAADWNWRAGQKANGNAEFTTGAKYFKNGLDLIGAGPKGIRFRFWLEWMACEWKRLPSTHLEALEIPKILRRAETRIESARIHGVLIDVLSHHGKHMDAVEVLRQGLALYGIEFPSSPAEAAAMGHKLQRKIENAMNGRPLLDLESLPAVRGTDPLIVMGLLVKGTVPSFFVSSDLLACSSLLLILHSIRKGESRYTPFSFLFYGWWHLAHKKDIERGHRLGELACRLSERQADASQICQIKEIFGSFVLHWRRSYGECIEVLQSSFDGAVRCGESLWAGFAVLNKVSARLAKGEPLSGVQDEILKFSHYIVSANSPNQVHHFGLRRDFIRVLQGELTLDQFANVESLSSSVLDINYAGRINLRFYLSAANLFAGRLDAARIHAEKVPPPESHLFNTSLVSLEFLFYSALADCLAYLQLTHSEKESARRKILFSARLLRKLAGFCDANFGGKFALLMAEIAFIRNRIDSARVWCEISLSSARRNGNLPLEGLASEGLIRVFLRQGKTAQARFRMQEAINSYERWGAVVRISVLNRNYLPSFAPIPPKLQMKVSAHESNPGKDEVFGILRGLANESSEKGLLEGFVARIAEVLGCERCLLTVPEGDIWTLAAGFPDSGSAGEFPLPMGIIRLTSRTRKEKSSPNGINDPIFCDDPYVRSERVRSFYCKPVFRQAEMMGCLYLENNRIQGAFPKWRTDILDQVISWVALVWTTIRLSEQRRNYVVHLHQAREKEKASISRDVHDELGSIFTALKFDAHWLRKSLPADGEATARARTIITWLDRGIASVQKISGDLRPVVLENLGLKDAVAWQMERFQEHSNMKVRWRIDGDFSMIEWDRSLAVYRILQESLTNVQRHSQASEVFIRLEASEGRCKLEIVDNGIGLDHEKANHADSHGLAGMRDRAEALGGRLTFAPSSMSGGTTVRLHMPIKEMK